MAVATSLCERRINILWLGGPEFKTDSGPLDFRAKFSKSIMVWITLRGALGVTLQFTEEVAGSNPAVSNLYYFHAKFSKSIMEYSNRKEAEMPGKFAVEVELWIYDGFDFVRVDPYREYYDDFVEANRVFNILVDYLNDDDECGHIVVHANVVFMDSLYEIDMRRYCA